MHHSTQRGTPRHSVRTAVLAAAGLTALALSACSGGASSPASGDATQSGSGTSRGAAAVADTDGGDRFALTYDGGIRVIDADDLSEVADLPLEGFNRLNSFGDGEHVLVSTEGGFQVLSTGAGGGSAGLTDLVFPATTPGHVVRHAGHTVLFDDGTGDITLLDTSALGSSADDTVATLPEGTASSTPRPPITGSRWNWRTGTWCAPSGTPSPAAVHSSRTPRGPRSAGSRRAPVSTVRVWRLAKRACWAGRAA